MKAFKATVAPGLIEKASRFFDNNLRTILNELAQNSRRAGATRLDISFARNYSTDKTTITLIDNGPGVDNPETLLTMGLSNWNDYIESEDPAGMGFFSLANTGCTAFSNNWSVDLLPEHFTGKIDIWPTELSSSVEGFGITFERDESRWEVESELEKIAKYYPLTVTLNGINVTQEDFLKDCILTDIYKGIRLGVVPYTEYSTPSINFHGVQVTGEFPTIAGADLRIMADVTSANKNLKLKLPDRSCVIEDTFWDELCNYSKKLIYKAIQEKLAGNHELSYDSWLEAKNRGFELPTAKAELPGLDIIAAKNSRYAYYATYENMKKVQIGKGNYVILPHSYKFLANTLSTIPDIKKKLQIVEDTPKYIGYFWYDTIPTITSIQIVDQEDNNVSIMSSNSISIDQDTGYSLDNLPEQLIIKLHINNGNIFTSPLDILICGTNSLEELAILPAIESINKYKSIPANIENAIVSATFSFTYSGGSKEAQLETHRKKVRALLSNIYLGKETGTKQLITDYLNQEEFIELAKTLGNTKLTISLDKNNTPIVKFTKPRSSNT